MIREGETVEQAMERVGKEREIATNIWCPYCNFKQYEETKQDYVSYWGDGDDKSCVCDECGKEFKVKENVDRTFETLKIEEEN